MVLLQPGLLSRYLTIGDILQGVSLNKLLHVDISTFSGKRTCGSHVRMDGGGISIFVNCVGTLPIWLYNSCEWTMVRVHVKLFFTGFSLRFLVVTRVT